MQSIKGLGILLAVAAVVFAIGAANDLKSQDRYAAKLRNAAGMETAANAAVNVAGNFKAGGAKAGEMGADTVGRVANITTNANVGEQARRKTPRT